MKRIFLIISIVIVVISFFIYIYNNYFIQVIPYNISNNIFLYIFGLSSLLNIIANFNSIIEAISKNIKPNLKLIPISNIDLQKHPEPLSIEQKINKYETLASLEEKKSFNSSVWTIFLKEDYLRDCKEYLEEINQLKIFKTRFKPISFVVENISSIEINNIKIELSFPNILLNEETKNQDHWTSFCNKEILEPNIEIYYFGFYNKLIQDSEPLKKQIGQEIIGPFFSGIRHNTIEYKISNLSAKDKTLPIKNFYVYFPKDFEDTKFKVSYKIFGSKIERPITGEIEYTVIVEENEIQE